MIVKRLKNLFRLTILIAVRQLWFLGTNIYQLYYQPYLTIKKIKDKGDKSQTFLLALTAISPFIVYIILRIIYDLLKYGRMVMVTGRVFGAMAVIQILMLAYLSYWTLKVLIKDHGNS